MKPTNGWGVYLKIKEISSRDGHNEVPTITLDELATTLGMNKAQVREYVVALATLDFIKYTDKTKEAFVITDLGR